MLHAQPCAMQSVGAADFTSGNPVELATATFLRVHYQGSSNTPTPTPTRKRRVSDSVIKNGDSCELLLCACKLHAAFCCVSYCTRSSSPSFLPPPPPPPTKSVNWSRMSQIFAKSQTTGSTRTKSTEFLKQKLIDIVTSKLNWPSITSITAHIAIAIVRHASSCGAHAAYGSKFARTFARRQPHMEDWRKTLQPRRIS